MANRPPQQADSMSVDVDNLYREESYTDLRAASVRVLIPVKLDGSADPSRPTHYIGDTTLMTQMGPLPVQFPLEADNLADALAKFPDGVREAIERLQERAKEMAREEASRIVVPGKAPGGMPGGGLGGGGFGGLGGKGKISFE
jgi:rhamnose utilization protein RhaD (predicted bifunctional aldolase and dehydrogenase)